MIPLIVILGPTGVGKTEIAIQLAEDLDGEIVSADSRLFYRGMDIGTAKPSPADLKRVPHHLVDVTTPDRPWSLAVFQGEARQAIASIHRGGHLPFLVGGTGQFIRAVTEEWDIPKVAPHPALRRVLETWSKEVSPQGLHDRLATLDPLAAAQIDPRNLRRTVRAMEVIFTTGQPFSSQKQRRSSPYQVLQLGLNRPRSELYARIDARIQSMLQAGLVDEVQVLLDLGYSSQLPALSAIGYREIIASLQGKISFEEAVVLIKRHTRTFVRRQANWFKESDPHIHWFQVGENTARELSELIKIWLAASGYRIKDNLELWKSN